MDKKRRYQLNRFYDDVMAHVGRPAGDEKIGFIVVNHTTQEMIPMLDALSDIGEVIRFIPKSSQKNEDAFRQIRQKYTVDQLVNKRALKIPQFATDYLERAIADFDGKVILIDEGGYFAHAYPQITEHPGIRDKLLGVIEGTENGHQKYEHTADISARPILSKARSPNKRPEDKQVGRSLVKMADFIMMDAQTKQIEDMPQVGVIGLGKVGMAAAQELLQRGQKPYVWDLNPFILSEAAARELRVAPDKETLLRECDMIFSATGNRSIRGEEWELLKDGAVIACATSGDDELDMSYLQENAVLHVGATASAKDAVDRYLLPSGGHINLLNEGNSVNFYQGRGVVSSALSLSLAEYVAGAALLAQSPEQFDAGEVLELDHALLRDLARIWLSHFTEYKLDASQLETREVDPDHVIAGISSQARTAGEAPDNDVSRAAYTSELAEQITTSIGHA